MLVGLPHSELLGSFQLSYYCHVPRKMTNYEADVQEATEVTEEMEAINIEINLKPSVMKYDAIIEVFMAEDKASLTLLKKIEIVQVIEANVKNYRVLNNITDSFQAILNWGEKSTAKLIVAINLEQCRFHHLTHALTSYDNIHILGIVIHASVNDTFLRSDCKILRLLNSTQQILSSSRNSVRQRVMRRALPFFDIPDMFKPNLPKLDCSNNTPPVAKEKSITFIVKSNVFTHIALNEDLFYDDEDGNLRMLKLKLKWENGDEINPEDWIQFNSVLKLIYTLATVDVFQKQPLDGYKFFAEVTDQCNSSVTANVYVQIKFPVSNNNKTVSAYCDYMALIVDTLADRTPFIHVLTELINKVITFSNINSADFFVLNVFRSFHKSRLVYSMLFTVNTCKNCKEDISAISANFNKSFKMYLMPNFNFIAALLSKCGINSSPQVVYQIDDLILSENRTTAFEISMGTFFDIEDGFLDNLTFRISEDSRVDGVLVILHNQTLFFYQYKYSINIGWINLTVTDSSQKSTALKVKVIPSRSLTFVSRWFTFTFDAYYDEFNSDKFILTNLLKAFSKFFGGWASMSDLILMGFDRKGVYPLLIELRLSFISIANKSSVAVTEMKNEILKKDGSATVKFATSLLPHIRNIHGSFHDAEGDTFNDIPPFAKLLKNPPSIMNYIPSLKVNTFDIFRYSIPNNTFVDDVDGNTRHLVLNFTELDGRMLRKNSWIQFHTERQEIYAALTADMMQKDKIKIFQFKLIAINSRQHMTNLTVNLVATRGVMAPAGTLVKVIIRDDVSSLDNDLQLLMEFLMRFTQIIKTSKKTELKNFSREKGLSTIALIYNYSTNYGLCDYKELNDWMNKAFRPNVTFGQNLKINDIFSDFIPNIFVLEIKVEKLGNCVENFSVFDFHEEKSIKTTSFPPALVSSRNRIALPLPTSPPVMGTLSWLKGPKIQIALPRIFVSFCKSVVYYLNPDTFFDQEDGNAKALEIELLHKTEGKVIFSYNYFLYVIWLWFFSVKDGFYLFLL